MFDDYRRIHCRSQILLEKGLSRYNISEDQKLSKNTQKFLFGQKMEVAKRRG
jgi:orotate phosphoribosyltransferase-like protein